MFCRTGNQGEGVWAGGEEVLYKPGNEHLRPKQRRLGISTSAAGSEGVRAIGVVRYNLSNNYIAWTMWRRRKADYEGDKYAKSAVESVQSRLLWWTARAGEHGIEPYPLTVDKLQLFGALLKAAGYRSAVSYMSIAKKQHKLGYLWTAASDLEMRDGKRACERSIGPPRKCGSFDLRKLASLQTTGAALLKGGPRWLREGALCGCWWAMREMELSTARCKQVTFNDGPGCGTCTFDLPVSKTDLQALGKRRTHTCACSGGVPGSDALCPVKVARSLHAAAFNFAPPGANPDTGMRLARAEKVG